MGRPVVHWELMSRSPEKIATFYEKIFDWKIRHVPEINYRFVETDSGADGRTGINGGILKPPRPEPWPGNMTCTLTSMTSPHIGRESSRRVARFTSKNRKCQEWAGSVYLQILRAE
jgi:predicted enzyme related to lactoylglutathione lyase